MTATRHTSVEAPVVEQGFEYRLVVPDTGEIAECADMMPLIRMALRNLAAHHAITIEQYPTRTRDLR